MGELVAFLFKLLAWIASITLGSIGFALIMRYGPTAGRPSGAGWRRAHCWRRRWIAISFGFSLYVAYVSDYNVTYGSLSAIVVLLMWLFLSACGVLAGALLNAEIERHVPSIRQPVQASHSGSVPSWPIWWRATCQWSNGCSRLKSARLSDTLSMIVRCSSGFHPAG